MRGLCWPLKKTEKTIIGENNEISEMSDDEFQSLMTDLADSAVEEAFV